MTNTTNNTVVSILLAVVPVTAGFIGIYINDRLTNGKNKIKMAYNIIKEWDYLRESRNQAYKIFVLDDPSKELFFYQKDLEERSYMYQVVEFFDRLNILYKADLIDKKTLSHSDIPEDYFDWNIEYFERQRNHKYETKEQKMYGQVFRNRHEWLIDMSNGIIRNNR